MDKGIEKAVLGIRYLIKYAKNSNEAYFPIIKDCAKEIRLWCLLTLFSNNMDDLWEGVPDFLLDDIFKMKEIETNNGFLYYGRGYDSQSSLTVQKEFKRIRDKLSHMDFSYHDDMIYLNDEAKTSFDVSWLECLVLTTIANFRNDLKKGMSDIANFSFLPNIPNLVKDFSFFWSLGLVQFFEVTLLNGNKDAWAKHFARTQIPAERYTFDLIFAAVKREVGGQRINLDVTLDELKKEIEQIFKRIEQKYNNFIKLELINTQEFDHITSDEAFKKLSFKGSQQYLINKLKLKDANFYNSIITQNIINILNDFQADYFDQDKLYLLRDAEAFLLKVYANILFSCVYVRRDNDWDLKRSLHTDFSFTTQFIHASHVYEDYLKRLNRALKEAREHQARGEYQMYIEKFIYYYTKLYEEALNNEVDKRLFWNIRNAIVHDQVEFKDGKVRLYITGRNIQVKHFQKKTQKWVDKEITNHQVIWEMTMSKDEFLNMMDKLFGWEQIPIQINISKYRRYK